MGMLALTVRERRRVRKEALREQAVREVSEVRGGSGRGQEAFVPGTPEHCQNIFQAHV